MHRPEWEGTTIAFDLQSEGSDIVLGFAQRGFAYADDGYALTTTGWAYYHVSLQQYLETGQGASHPDVDFARLIISGSRVTSGYPNSAAVAAMSRSPRSGMANRWCDRDTIAGVSGTT